MEDDTEFNLDHKLDSDIYLDVKAELPGVDIDLSGQTDEPVILHTDAYENLQTMTT